MAESREDPSSTGHASKRSEQRDDWSRNNEIQEDLSLSLNTFDDHIQAGLAELRSLVSKLRGERTSLTQHIKNLGAELHQITVARDHLQHTVSHQQKENVDIKEQFKKKGDENVKLQQEIKEMDDLYNNHLQKIAGRHRHRTLAQKSVAKWRRKMHSLPRAQKVQLSMLEAENEHLRAELLACQEAAKQAFLFSANTLNTQALNMFQDAATRRLGLDVNEENEQEGQQSSQFSSRSTSPISTSSQQSATTSQDSKSEHTTRSGDKENILVGESENRVNDERKIGKSVSDIRDSREVGRSRSDLRENREVGRSESDIRESIEDARKEKNHRRDEHTRREENRYESDEQRSDDNRTRRSARENLIRVEDNFPSSEQGNLSVRNKNMMGHGRGNYYNDVPGPSEIGKGSFTFEMRGHRFDNLDHHQHGNINDYRFQSDTNLSHYNDMRRTTNHSITSLNAEPLRQETLANLCQLREEQQRRPSQPVTSVYEPQRKTPRTITSQKISSSKCSCSQLTKVSGPFRCPYCNPIHNIRDDPPVNKTQQIGPRPRNTVLSERDKRKVIYKPSASTVVIEKHLNK